MGRKRIVTTDDTVVALYYIVPQERLSLPRWDIYLMA